MANFRQILRKISKIISPFRYRTTPHSPTLKPQKKTEKLPVSIQRITLQDGFVHTYTDGSCNYYKKLLGLGVVIPTNEPSLRIIFSKRVKLQEGYNFRQFGAMRAEFMAATVSLKNLPEGTNVHFYTDHPILRKVLKRHISGHNLLWAPRKQNKHSVEFVEMVHDLRAELQTMGTIKVTSLNDRISRRMALAHKAAARGSGAKGIKVRRAKKPRPTEESTLSLEDPRDVDVLRDSSTDTAHNKPNPLDRITFD